MTKKRRNGGRNKNGRGHVNSVRCSNCSRMCPKARPQAAIIDPLQALTLPFYRTRPSAASRSATWSSRLPSVTCRTLPSTLVSRAHCSEAGMLTGVVPPEYVLPKLYLKIHYCISCALHSRVVRVRSREGRRNRAPPPRVRYNKDGKKITYVLFIAAE